MAKCCVKCIKHPFHLINNFQIIRMFPSQKRHSINQEYLTRDKVKQNLNYHKKTQLGTLIAFFSKYFFFF